MKGTLTILSLGMVIALSACIKEKQSEPQLFVAATVKSQPWTGVPTVTFPTPDSLLIVGNKAGGAEILQFKLRFQGAGVYKLGIKDAAYMINNGTISTNYKLDTTKVNTVKVDSYFVESGATTGNFTLNFKKSNTGLGDSTVLFNNGQFWVVTPRP